MHRATANLCGLLIPSRMWCQHCWTKHQFVKDLPMQILIRCVSMIALVGLFGCGSLADSITDALTAGYDFETSCSSSDENTCGDCCIDISYDTSAHSSDDGCGCGKWDETSCASSTDSDSCTSCCGALGDNYGAMSLYSGDTCSCLWNGKS